MARENAEVLNESDVYREWTPPSVWRHAVACLWEQRVSQDRVQRVVPDGCADLLSFDDGTLFVVGVADEVALPVLGAGTRVLGIRLLPHAVGAAFGVPASVLRNRTIPADAVLGARRARHLSDPEGRDAWIRSIAPDRRVERAVELLATRPVTVAADRLGVTPRQLRRVLGEEVGLAPKVYQRVLRFRRFLRLAEAGSGLAAAAAGAGYADQAHLTRDVKELSGLTPAQLMAERAV